MTLMNFMRGNGSLEMSAKMAALDKSQAVIEFKLDGSIVTANDNFLGAVGYSLDEIKGKHHSLFVEPQMRDSVEYRGFWDALRRGEHQVREFKRIAKGGRPIWIQASYNPLLDRKGKLKWYLQVRRGEHQSRSKGLTG